MLIVLCQLHEKKCVEGVYFNTVAMVTKMFVLYYVQSVTWFIFILFMGKKQRVIYCISWSCHIYLPSFFSIFRLFHSHGGFTEIAGFHLN
jgi:hypothetical protein